MCIRDRLKKALTSDFTESSFSLSQWPIQIKLAPINAPYFSKCNLLIAADCSGYAYGNFHREFVDGKITLIGCPKLDDVYYGDKLASIFASNDIPVSYTHLTPLTFPFPLSTRGNF